MKPFLMSASLLLISLCACQPWQPDMPVRRDPNAWLSLEVQHSQRADVWSEIFSVAATGTIEYSSYGPNGNNPVTRRSLTREETQTIEDLLKHQVFKEEYTFDTPLTILVVYSNEGTKKLAMPTRKMGPALERVLSIIRAALQRAPE
jgi:hypothetical protein